MKFTLRERFGMFLAVALIVLLLLVINYLMQNNPIYLAKIPEGIPGQPDIYGLFLTYYQKLVDTNLQFISTVLLLLGGGGFGILAIIWYGFQQFQRIQTDAQKIKTNLTDQKKELDDLNRAIQGLKDSAVEVFKLVFDKLFANEKDDINGEMRVLRQQIKNTQKDVNLQLPRWVTMAEIDDLNLKLLSGDKSLIKYAKRRLLEYAKDDDGVIRIKSIRVFEDITAYQVAISQTDIEDIKNSLSVVKITDPQPGVRKAATRVITQLTDTGSMKKDSVFTNA